MIQLGPSREIRSQQRFPDQLVEAFGGIGLANLVVRKHRRISLQNAFNQLRTNPELRPSFHFPHEFVVHKYAHADAGQIRASIFDFFENGCGHGLRPQQAQPGPAQVFEGRPVTRANYRMRRDERGAASDIFRFHGTPTQRHALASGRPYTAGYGPFRLLVLNTAAVRIPALAANPKR